MSARERQQYYLEANPDLWTRVKRATEDSWITLKGTGEEVLVFSAAALPWSLPVLVLAALFWLAGRWLTRRFIRWLTTLFPLRTHQEG